MIQIDTNSTFFLIRSNEEIRGAWNVAHNTVKIYVAKAYIHTFFIHVAKMLWIAKFQGL